MMEDIGRRIVSGAIWTVLMRNSVRFLGIISIVILARILNPSDFGIVAKASLVFGLLELISQFGFDNALIRKNDLTSSDYNTAWTLSLIRALIIGFVLMILAWPSSIYFNQPELINIIIVYAFISILGGFVNIGVIDFRRDMKFNLDFRFNLIGKLISFFSTLAFAYVYETYWALVFGAFIKTLSSVVLGYIMSSYRPKFELSKWRDLMDFSKWIFGYELLTAVSTKLDTFILSRFADAYTLGIYTVAYEIGGTPSTELSQPVARAALPGLAKLNDDTSKFKEMYMATLSLVLFLAIPASMGMSAVSEDISDVLLGEKWAGAGELISVIAIFGLIRAVNATSVAALMAFKRPSVLVTLSCFTLFVRLICLPLGMYVAGVVGMCWGAVGAAFLNATVSLVVQQRMKIISLKELVGNLYRSFFASVVMFYVVNSVNFSLSLIHLIYLIVIGVATYLGVILLLFYLTAPKSSPEEMVISHIGRVVARFKS